MNKSNIEDKGMAKVILICGKICCGKSTYAERLRVEVNAVILSVDEIMLALFGLYAGDRHDEYAAKTKKYLLDKSVEIIESGANVILDWGFWTKDERSSVKEFFTAKKIAHEFHYLDVNDKTWRVRLDKRNHAVSEGKVNAYIVDENLAAKFDRIFQMPDREEIDMWIEY